MAGKLIITPNTGSTTAGNDPKIQFQGTGNSTDITLRTTTDGTLSFEGTSGQLFSISDSMSGTIFSANDVSGIPSIEVLDTGLVKLAQYSGNVVLGSATDNTIDKLQVAGSVTATTVKSTIATGTAPLTVASTTIVPNLNADLHDGHHIATASTISTSVARDTVGDINVRLVRQEYPNEVAISGGMVFRVNNSTDNFLRVCNDPAAIRTYLSAQTSGTYATGTGSASGTNTGDETTATIKSKLGITTLTGSNTGDQTIPTTLPNANAVTFATTGGATAGSTYTGAATLTVDYSTVGAAASGHTHSYQAADGDLLAISGLVGTTGLLRKTAADTWTLDTASYLTTTGSAASLTSFPTLNQNTTGSAATLTTSRNINGVTFDGSADIITPTIYDAGFTRIVNPGGGAYVSGISTVTGALKITLPVGMIGSMLRMTIRVYEYSTGESFDVYVGGYNYQTGNTWGYNPFAYIVGNPSANNNLTVRMGYTAGAKAVIYIGELATVWSYPQFFVTDVQIGYAGLSVAYTTGWVCSIESAAFENVTATISNIQVGQLSTTAPAALGTAAVGTSTTVARSDHVHLAPTTITGNAGTATSLAGGLVGQIPYQTAVNTTAMLAAGTVGQVLKSNAGAAPSWATLDMTYLPDSTFKKSVTVATTINIALTAPQTVDGIAVVAGNRVLVKDQTTLSQNGIYQVNAGAWTRVADADSTTKIASALVAVDSGSTNGGKLFDNDLKTTDVLGTTAYIWNKVIDDGYLVAAGSAIVGAPKYNGTTALAGAFDGGTTTPTSSTRLNYGGYFYPTYLNLVGSSDTSTAATHYFVETGTDGYVRPKTLADTKTELVTSAAVLSGLGSNTAKTFLAAPNGAAGNATFRTIVASDIPTLNQNTAGSSALLQSINSRVVVDTPQSFSAGIRGDFKTNTTDGLVDGGLYHGVLTFRQYANGSDWSGGGVRQVGFTDNHNMWLRGANADTTWTSWTKVLTEANTPIASSSSLGRVKVGAGLIIDGTGVLSSSIVSTAPILISTNTAAVAGTSYVMTAALTLTLPPSPAIGSTVVVQSTTNATCTIARAGQPIMGLLEDLIIDAINTSAKLIYTDITQGWLVTEVTATQIASTTIIQALPSGNQDYHYGFTTETVQNPGGSWGKAVMFYKPTGQTYGLRVDRADYADALTNYPVNSTTTNNEANKLVRTDSSGYANFGWINTVSGTATGTLTRVYCSQDAYLRYLIPDAFITSMGVATVASPTFTGTAITPNININRQGNTASGIRWYNGSMTAWCDYMSSPVASTGPTGTITAPSGTLVTSWAKRSFIENVAGYGWTFESGTSTSTTPIVVAEIRSSDGAAKFGGAVTAPSFIGSAASLIGLTSAQVVGALGYTPSNPGGLTVVVISTNTPAVVGSTYVLIAALTLTLPASPTAGSMISIINRSASFTCIIGRNGQYIMGLAEDMTLNSANPLSLVFADAARGWVIL